mmetsp:Transcript_15195/g.28911  ORF Transcript_15195/g.28911 Transcript_15195/m.28911 type:complete len:203 (-) Transcript_15195:46-654(-)
MIKLRPKNFEHVEHGLRLHVELDVYLHLSVRSLARDNLFDNRDRRDALRSKGSPILAVLAGKCGCDEARSIAQFGRLRRQSFRHSWNHTRYPSVNLCESELSCDGEGVDGKPLLQLHRISIVNARVQGQRFDGNLYPLRGFWAGFRNHVAQHHAKLSLHRAELNPESRSPVLARVHVEHSVALLTVWVGLDAYGITLVVVHR